MIVSLQKLFPVNSFARGVAVLSSGTAAAQILLLLAAPVLTRLYSPEDFGVLAVFVSILGILGVIASLRYELAIPIAENDQTALNTVALCLLISTGMAILTSAAVWMLGDWIASLLKISHFASYLWLLPVGVFLIGVYQTFSYWATRKKAFGLISKTKLSQSVGNLIIQFSLFKLGPLALITGYIAGQFVGVGRLTNSAYCTTDIKSVSLSRIRNTASRFRRFPIFATWSGLLNSLGQQLAPLLLAGFFGPLVAGWFALANRIVTSPALVFGTAIGNVFFAHAPEAKKNNQLVQLVEDTQEKLMAIFLPVTMIVLLFGEYLFTLVFGPSWSEAGQMAQWLILSSFVGFLISAVSMIFSVFERQDLGLILQLSLFLLRVSGLTIGIVFDDFILAITLFALGGVVGYSLYVVAIMKLTGTSVKNFLKSCSHYFLLSALIFAPVLMVSHIDGLLTINILAVTTSLIGVTLYYFFTVKNLFVTNN